MDDTRVDHWLQGKLSRATRPRQAAALIAAVTILITLVSGVLMTLVDRENFPSVGLGLWWAVQTVTTVGYGDYVPKDVAGRIMATLVMVGGIGFLSVVTAAITSGFVARSRQEHARAQDAPPSAEVLQEILVSLRRLEQKMGDRA